MFGKAWKCAKSCATYAHMCWLFVIVKNCIPGVWLCFMAQALLDLSYYKCGHCDQSFNSLAAFGKHQKNLHTPDNCPKNRSKKEDEKDSPCCFLDFILKVKLCQHCARGVRLISSKKALDIPLCGACRERNGFV